MIMKRALILLVALMLLLPCAYAGENALHLLLIGVDSSAEGQRGRSDTMMLARVDAATGSVRLVSFLRDLYVSIPGYGKTRLNAAYFYGGETLLKETLQKQFGVTIDRTVTVRFSVLEELVNQLGGIEIELLEKERLHLNRLLEESGMGSEKLAQAGSQRLNGRQALMYSRIRKIDDDFQRTSRQQTVIAAMLRQMAGMDRWDLFKLAVKNLGKVETDLSISDLSRLAPLFGRLGDLDIQTAHVPFDGTFSDATINGMMVLQANTEANRLKLEAFLSE